MAVESVFPVWNILLFPERYPSYMGNLMGFDPTTLPKAYNPIIAATGKKGYELLYEDFIDGVKVEHYRPRPMGTSTGSFTRNRTRSSHFRRSSQARPRHGMTSSHTGRSDISAYEKSHPRTAK